MSETTERSWWSRNFWIIVLFPCLAAVALAGVSVFKGWLHQRAGFDSDGKPLVKDTAPTKLREPVSAVAAYQRIVADLQRRAAEVRPRLRYLTLLHRHNEPSCTTAELETERQTVRTLVTLLWKGKTSQVDFIDPEQLIFRLDLEDLEWNPDTDWHKIAVQYRYGLGGKGDDPLAKLRQQVEEFTQEKIGIVRADWFAVALARPPLSGPNGLLKTSLNELPEALRTLSRQYSAQTLDLASCARELGLEDTKTLSDLIQQKENLQQEFGLAPLLKGERIRREWWESDRNFFSPYQELARQLKLGQPVRVQ
jgi:hypothetical protein